MPYVIMAAGESERRSIVGAAATPKLVMDKVAEITRQGMRDILVCDESATLYSLADFRRHFLPTESDV
jgi:hypothetical protein